jgi:hypothetical protein
MSHDNDSARKKKLYKLEAWMDTSTVHYMSDDGESGLKLRIRVSDEMGKIYTSSAR